MPRLSAARGITYRLRLVWRPEKNAFAMLLESQIHDGFRRRVLMTTCFGDDAVRGAPGATPSRGTNAISASPISLSIDVLRRQTATERQKSKPTAADESYATEES